MIAIKFFGLLPRTPDPARHIVSGAGSTCGTQYNSLHVVIAAADRFDVLCADEKKDNRVGLTIASR